MNHIYFSSLVISGGTIIYRVSTYQPASERTYKGINTPTWYFQGQFEGIDEVDRVVSLGKPLRKHPRLSLETAVRD